MPELREDFYRLCLMPYDGTFASGARANNKLEGERARRNPVFRERAADAVFQIAKKFNPDMIMPVADGANWLGIEVAWRLGAAIILLHKNADTKELSLYPGTDEFLTTSGRLLIVEDVFNNLTNTAKVLAIPGVRERAVGAVAIDDRGDPNNRHYVNLPHEAAISEYIPPMLPADSPLWEYMI